MYIPKESPATIYKLTDQNLRTHNGFQWVLGEERHTNAVGNPCGPGWLHSYTHPLLAVLLNPIHANIKNPKLFRGEAWGEFLNDYGLKQGHSHMCIVEELVLPEITAVQRVGFSILCAMQACQDKKWKRWAGKWLSGQDRSQAAARSAAWAAQSVAWAAQSAAEAAWAAQSAARSAAWAAQSAAWAAEAAWAAWAAEAARSAAEAARAAGAAESLDLISLAHQALEIK